MKHFSILEPHFLNTAKSSRLVWIDTLWPFIHIRKGEPVSKAPIDVPKETAIDMMAEQAMAHYKWAKSQGIDTLTDDWLIHLKRELEESQTKPRIINRPKEHKDE